MILRLLKVMLPPDAKLPKNCYEAKKIIKDLGLNYEKIHACPNDCMLFWKEHANDYFCKCGACPNGFAPSRAMLYNQLTQGQTPDGTTISEVASANIEKMQDLLKSRPNSLEGNSKGSIYWSQNDIYSQVITKKERHGRRCGCGFGYTAKSNNLTFNGPLSFNVVDEQERMRDKETVSKLEETVQAQADEMQAQAREMSTLKEQVALLMRLMPGVTGLQVRDGCNDPPDEASPRTHQRSSHASHDFECSPQGNRMI
ncbi:hypothetical protein Vadar_022043 [Vaccinium darrowii]|uniref:Uncharacterized protein n=1 Tax=Vaccinium darrowii TaxID=229202 RepID=A0ACB7X2U6_9ERIC|nr:hypothetical protein Vadar_022043 [Vaccinium darrowii]